MASSAFALPDDVCARVAMVLASLAPAEQRVGRIILSRPATAAHLTITDLAGMAETSQTTVIRFCRSIGIGSYSHLKIALATAAGRAGATAPPRLSPDVNPDDDMASMIAKIAAADIQAITDTVANLDPKVLEMAVDAVDKAHRVDVYGAAASGTVALDLQSKLHRIGLIAFAFSDPHLAIPSAANLIPGDVAIAISHSGTTTDTVDALSQAKGAGATTVAITNRLRSRIVSVADIVLHTSVSHTSETALRSGAMASRMAELIIVDCLFIGVAQRRYEETLAALVRTRDAVRSRHPEHRAPRNSTSPLPLDPVNSAPDTSAMSTTVFSRRQPAQNRRVTSPRRPSQGGH
jgi:DNA-binding MurR/RpiR family transcriptional regulator